MAGQYGWLVASLASICLGAGAVHAQPDGIVLRDRARVLDDTVGEATPAGLRLERGRSLIGWDRVAAVPEASAEECAEFLQLGADLWRARGRLARGHALLAGAVLEPHEASLLAEAGPTAAVLHRDLLEARLRHGDMHKATRSWLAWAYAEDLSPARFGADRTDATTNHGDAGETLGRIHAGTGLIPVLPPVPLLNAEGAGEALAVAAFDPSTSIPSGVSRAQRRALVLARLYVSAAQVERGDFSPGGAPVEGVSEELGTDPGVALVADMVLARISDAPGRAEARDRLRSRLGPEAGGWIEAWCRLGLGWSLLAEPETASRELGIIELLHLPARFAETEPYLAGLGLGAAFVAMEQFGSEDAGVLGRLLRERYAEHPVLLMPAVREALDRNTTGARSRSSTSPPNEPTSNDRP